MLCQIVGIIASGSSSVGNSSLGDSAGGGVGDSKVGGRVVNEVVFVVFNVRNATRGLQLYCTVMSNVWRRRC